MNDERHIIKVLGLLFEQARQVILGDGPDGQVGIRRLPQHLPPGGEDLAERLLLAPVAHGLTGLRVGRGSDRHHGITGHMSNVSEPSLRRQDEPQ